MISGSTARFSMAASFLLAAGVGPFFGGSSFGSFTVFDFGFVACVVLAVLDFLAA